MINDPRDFDPDNFVLTKTDVIDFIDVVLEYWSRTKSDKIRNLKLIGGLEMMKIGVKFTNEEDFKTIWSMMLAFIAELQYQNAISGALQNGDLWGETVAKLKSNLKNGGLEKMMEKIINAKSR